MKTISILSCMIAMATIPIGAVLFLWRNETANWDVPMLGVLLFVSGLMHFATFAILTKAIDVAYIMARRMGRRGNDQGKDN